MNYLTAQDQARLQEQLAELIKLRLVLSDRIGRARELGDLRENAEYHTAKDDQGHNERKIRDIEKKLASAVVVGDQDMPEGMVFIGATVRLRDVNSGEEDLYRLVGEPVDDPDADYIEVTPNSPMGMSLLKAHVGETVRVDLPRGAKKYEIVEIT
ncbi:MAG: transcription elongation factor GreA [Planctomycetes bacterium]|nr:transcription elongation factor GreA [Planctomycetota bacterium]